MKVLIVGSGGREHALAWKAAQSPEVEQVFVAPGNAGTAGETGVENVAISVADLDGLLGFARERGVGLTITGPEDPLVNGIVDRFSEAGLDCFGPSAAAARLDGVSRRALDLIRSEFESRTWEAFWGVAVGRGKPADVAADLGMTVAAVYMAKSRVLRRLREEFTELLD